MSRTQTINLNYDTGSSLGVVPISIALNRDSQGFANGIWHCGFSFLDNQELQDASAVRVAGQLARAVRKINRVFAEGSIAARELTACSRPSLASALLEAIANSDPTRRTERTGYAN